MKKLLSVMFALLLLLTLTVPVFAEDAPAPETAAASEKAEEAPVDNTTSAKAWAAGIAITVVAATGAIAMGLAIGKASDGISRQPEAAGQIRSGMMLGLVFIETAIIYALIVAILLIFVL